MAKIVEQLLEIHKIDQQLCEVARQAERLPAEVVAGEAELAGLEEQKAGLLAEARTKRVDADKSNVEVKTIEEKIGKYQAQLNITKTQKEYDTLKHEISVAEEQISEIETSALTAYEGADALEAGARELDPQMGEVGKALEARRAELDDRLADLEHSKEKLLRERGEKTGAIDADDFKRYELVRSKHPEGAMTLVTEGLCTLCNIKLTPQSYNLALIGEQIQQCRSCGRICYSEDGSGAG